MTNKAKKICSKCKETKSFAEFSKNCTRRDGYQNQCKICKSNSNKKYNQTEKGKTTRKVSDKRFHICHPKHRKVGNAVRNAIIAGRLPRPDTLQCHYCPVPAEQYHHPDYSKPFYIFPVCKKCHQKCKKKIAV